MNILAIETSCDETSVALVRKPYEVCSNVIFSQVDLHGPYGGVVPEIACRSHVEVLPGVIEEGLQQAGAGWNDVDAIAVTYGPGLASSLLVGLAAAKALAMRLKKPICYVNHLQGHIYSPFLAPEAPAPESVFPFLSLVVSGGHTCLVRVDALGKSTLLGQTIDDAAGEAFDKGANLLGLGYPGGPIMDKLGREGNPDFHAFPRGRAKRERGLINGMDSDLCFSYSGLKTALLYYLKQNPIEDGNQQLLADVVASYQEAIVDSLVRKTAKAMKDIDTLAVGGGVSLNSRLRSRLAAYAEANGKQLLLAQAKHCGDNAAMIGCIAGLGLGRWGDSLMDCDASPNLRVTEQ
ncbi:MAG: tRNA (adenosine(37)-N6)-threonylcarbamoyltransferase complex transferase subunit TsaD [Verrucomicrobia bacterium]|nr:tRNA (adenosine(37)-N6)-threonylcarbamoyltransferase complex transferase subunit TsaD [Verrucomicrobiota bacterium]